MENSQSAHSANEKACSEENTTKDVAKRPFDQEIGMGVNRGLHQPQQQENSLFELKGKKTGRNEGSGLLRFYRMGPQSYSASNFLHSARQGKRTQKATQRSSGLPPQFQKRAIPWFQ